MGINREGDCNERRASAEGKWWFGAWLRSSAFQQTTLLLRQLQARIASCRWHLRWQQQGLRATSLSCLRRLGWPLPCTSVWLGRVTGSCPDQPFVDTNALSSLPVIDPIAHKGIWLAGSSPAAGCVFRRRQCCASLDASCRAWLEGCGVPFGSSHTHQPRRRNDPPCQLHESTRGGAIANCGLSHSLRCQYARCLPVALSSSFPVAGFCPCRTGYACGRA